MKALSKIAVCYAVQGPGQQVPGLRRDAVRRPTEQVLVAALQADLTSVKCQEQGPTVGPLESGEATTLTDWIGVEPAQVVADVEMLGALVHARQ